MPPMKPNEWNAGSAMNSRSSRPKSMRASACATFARTLRWERTTPLGVPSVPEVNKITAQSSGLRATSGFFARSAPRSLSAKLTVLRTSSR